MHRNNQEITVRLSYSVTDDMIRSNGNLLASGLGECMDIYKDTLGLTGTIFISTGNILIVLKNFVLSVERDRK